jgi:hypothetical protein
VKVLVFGGVMAWTFAEALVYGSGQSSGHTLRTASHRRISSPPTAKTARASVTGPRVDTFEGYYALELETRGHRPDGADVFYS